MGDSTTISWTSATWNPWMGCHKVSQGCKACYMYRDMKKYGRDPRVVVRSKTTFKAPLTWKDPRVIFTCSWSDWFIEEADAWRDEAWDIIKQTPRHTYQILTKRADQIADHLPDDWGTGYPNVWLGVSAENQEAADLRIPYLMSVPAAVRFISAEPLLGPINLHPAWMQGVFKLNWIIVGGESGPDARQMDMEWARGIKDQCLNTGVAFFFKQQTGFRSGHKPYIEEPDGSQWAWHQMPNDLKAPERVDISADSRGR